MEAIIEFAILLATWTIFFISSAALLSVPVIIAVKTGNLTGANLNSSDENKTKEE